MDGEIVSNGEMALHARGQDDPVEAAHLLLKLIREAKSDGDRYFPYLYYGEALARMGNWEEAKEALLRSAHIALHCQKDEWLVLSHEKLGSLSAAQENWFGALHHYQYALRKADPARDRAAFEMLKAKANSAQSTLHAKILSQDARILPLSKEYRSGNLAISFVHRDIFLNTYFARCLECDFCHDWCCSFGADIDIQNVEKIQQQQQEIKLFIRPSTVEWFEAEYTYYEEYTGEQYTRINPQGPRCVFISQDQRGCGLHRYALSKGMDYHEIKPPVCILFPLSFGEGILKIAPELDDHSLICAGSGASVYRSMRSELEYYFGRELVEELDTVENAL